MTRACDSCTDHDQRNLQRERVTVSEEYLKDITNVLLESVEKTCQGSDRAPLERERERQRLNEVVKRRQVPMRNGGGGSQRRSLPETACASQSLVPATCR
jgi:hypothetical protein